METFIQQTRAISDPARVRMLKLLHGGELCVCEIMDVMGLGQSTASKHLGILKAAGMAESRKEGTWSYYRLAEKARGHNRDFLKFIDARLNDDEAVKKDRKRLEKRKLTGCRT
jgi:DNA-binding transcriptional ArsR family regulator